MSPRTVLIHLNVEVPDEDERDPEAIGQAISGVLEVGQDDDSVRDLVIFVALTDEV